MMIVGVLPTCSKMGCENEATRILSHRDVKTLRRWTTPRCSDHDPVSTGQAGAVLTSELTVNPDPVVVAP